MRRKTPFCCVENWSVQRIMNSPEAEEDVVVPISINQSGALTSSDACDIFKEEKAMSLLDMFYIAGPCYECRSRHSF